MAKKTKKTIKNVAPPEKQPDPIIPREIKNEASHMIRNGYSDALLGFNPGSIGVELSQVDTLFKNNRWYLISNMRQLLSEIYVEHGLIQTVIDVPVDDGLRGGIEIKSKQLGEEELVRLRTIVERESLLDAVVGRALKWNRLFGGAGVLILTDQDPTTPLDISQLSEDRPLEFRAVDMWELYWDKQNTEGYDAALQEQEFEFYSYYGQKLHKSRVRKMKGMTAPSFIRPRLRGWGFSVVESLVRSINQYLKSNDLTFEVLDEFKIDVYRLKDLAATLMSADGTAEVQNRMQLVNQVKNYQSAIVMDLEDEYTQKQLSFAGIADMFREFRMQIACDLRMPISKIFGISSTGFSSGEDDIENYHAMVESQVREKCKYIILDLLEMICQREFGMIPDDLTIDFKPLRILSAEQEENVKTQQFTRLQQAVATGMIDQKTFLQACNKDNLLGIQVDIEAMASMDLQPTTDEASAEGGGDEGGEGANEPDSAKVAVEDAPAEAENPDEPKEDEVPEAPELEEPKEKEVKNAADWDESKHPRADDGKFGKGTGSVSAKTEKSPGKKSKVEVERTPSAGKFKGFSEVQEPAREGSRTKSVEDLCKYSGANAGKPSKIPYQSPKGATANLVGHVAFGKASLKAQQELNERIQASEIILSKMGVKLKTPLDFVCQNIATGKQTTATYTPFTSKGTVNPRIDIKSKADLSKSILHEIGHAIDYALSEREGYASSSIHTGKTAGTGAPNPELQKVHTELSELFLGTEFYKDAGSSHQKYLKTPTEQFARAFEVYSYGKAKELAAAGEIPAEFVEEFKPDMFKKKHTLLWEMKDSLSAIVKQYREAASLAVVEKDSAKQKEMMGRVDQLKAEYDKARATFDELAEKTSGFEPIPEEKQQEYIDKISKIMGDLLSKDTIKNTISRFFNRMYKGER